MAKRASFSPLDVKTTAGLAFINAHFPGHPIQLVRRTRNLPRGQCYSNVRQVVASSGGEAITGYLLVRWPGHFFEALHHAVWRNPSGVIEDVTSPAYDGLERYDSCYFALDGQVLGEDDMAVPSKFKIITSDRHTVRWTRLAVKRMETYGIMLSFPHKIQHIPGQGNAMIFEDESALIDLKREMESISAELHVLWRKML